MSWALPLSLAMLIFLVLATRFIIPTPKVALSSTRGEFLKRFRELGPIKPGELQVAAVFTGMVAFWLLPDLAELFFPGSVVTVNLKQSLSISTTAILFSSLLFLLPIRDGESYSFNLKWEDLTQIDWGTILLFGGGLTLGTMLDQTGMAEQIASSLFYSEASPLYITAVGILLALMFSEFASNTASAAIIIPIMLSVAPHLDPSTALPMVVAVTFASSFGFVLPVSTPPNAIIFGTGEIKLRTLARVGAIFDVVGVILILTWFCILGASLF